MYYRTGILAIFAALILASGFGCQKSASPVAIARPPTVLSSNTIVSLHWLGKRRLELDAGAFFFVRIWSLPETVRLQSQVFDRIAEGGWRGWFDGTTTAQLPPAALRPLLNDLAKEECYLEARAAIGSPPSLVFAIHVNSQQAGVWETNLAVASEMLSGVAAMPKPDIHGWGLTETNSHRRIALSRVGDWTLVGDDAQTNSLLKEIAARIQRDSVPFVSSGTNLWLEAKCDWPGLLSAYPALPWPEAIRRLAGMTSTPNAENTPPGLKHLELNLSGDGHNLITQARADFSGSLPSQLPSWRIPIDLIHEPITSFTAVRGVQPWLLSWPDWNRLEISTPEQFYLWSQSGSPYRVYLAMTLSNAVHEVSALSDRLMQDANPWLAAHGYISFDRAPATNGITWGHLAEIQPFLKFAGATNNDLLYAGLLPEPDSGDTLAADLNRVTGGWLERADLVYYDWESTGSRLEPCFTLGQTARQIFRQPLLPPDSITVGWLNCLENWLGASTTTLVQSASNQLVFYRKSTLGFTAPELQALAGWLESLNQTADSLMSR